MLIVLDKDGTLLDTERTWENVAGLMVADLAAADSSRYARLCCELGLDPDTQKLRPEGLLRTGTFSQIEQRLPGLGTAAKAWFRTLDAERVNFVPAIALKPFLTRLRAGGHRLALLTNDGRTTTEAFLRQQDVHDLLDLVVCADDGFPPKPSADALVHIARRLGVQTDACAMVGDSIQDVTCGNLAAAGLVIGLAPEGPLASSLRSSGAHIVIPDIASLPDALASACNNSPEVVAASPSQRDPSPHAHQAQRYVPPAPLSPVQQTSRAPPPAPPRPPLPLAARETPATLRAL